MFSPAPSDPYEVPSIRARAAIARWFLAGFLAPGRALAGARGSLFPLAPVALGTGVGVYFALPQEPGGLALAVMGLALGLSLLAGLFGPEGGRPLALALALLLAGPLLAGWRSHAVAAPVLGWHRYGPVEGRIVGVDRSASDAIRLTLDQVVLPGVDPERVPGRVRISVQGALDVDPVPGTRVMLTGHLGPPPGPVEPGGFDFRRLAWFEGLGALGYTRTPVLALDDPEPGLDLALTRWRLSIARGIRERLPGEAGGFVAAILTGDRSGVGAQTTEDLRRSNLSHLLAISGLHMGLLTGVVYGGLRALLALFPVLALNWPIRKLAALGALTAAAAYLALSGGNVATQRAFVMAAVMLVAVLVERRALSLRSVALAALILLAWRPESLLSAGFQMSFAATIALVATFRWLNARRKGQSRPRGGWRRWLAPLVGAALCSLVAGLATAPYSAALFHRYAEYGLLANLVSVPLMGILVMPSAVLAAVLWPLGLEQAGLWLMELGTRWILTVAASVGGMDGAVRTIPAPPWWAIPALSLGALWLILWPGRSRLVGLVGLVAALAGWAMVERPALLIDRDGALIGIMGPEGRALSRARGAGYVAENWLLADGDGATQAEAAARPGFDRVDGGVRFHFAGRDWFHLTGQRGLAALDAHCHSGRIIVIDRAVPRAARVGAERVGAERVGAPPASRPASDQGHTGCEVLDPPRLSRGGGARALTPTGQILTTREVVGRRPWSRR